MKTETVWGHFVLELLVVKYYRTNLQGSLETDSNNKKSYHFTQELEDKLQYCTKSKNKHS